MSDEEFIFALGGIYEHSDWVPRRISRQRPFRDGKHLVQAMREEVDQASAEEKLNLICAHPDLAGKLARAGALTKESAREQASLGLDRLSDAEYEEFSTSNRRYREKFGFPFIICARLTTKQGVLDAFVKRLVNPQQEEVFEALLQIHQIARLRFEEVVAS